MAEPITNFEQFMREAEKTNLTAADLAAALRVRPEFDNEAREWAWQQVREQVGTENWTAGEAATYFGFFCWGWQYRAQLESQRNAGVKGLDDAQS